MSTSNQSKTLRGLRITSRMGSTYLICQSWVTLFRGSWRTRWHSTMSKSSRSNVHIARLGARKLKAATRWPATSVTSFSAGFALQKLKAIIISMGAPNAGAQSNSKQYKMYSIQMMQNLTSKCLSKCWSKCSKKWIWKVRTKWTPTSSLNVQAAKPSTYRNSASTPSSAMAALQSTVSSARTFFTNQKKKQIPSKTPK